jgi:AraC-like DNA-binding protein
MDLISIIILLGIAQGFFIGILLIMMQTPNRRANRVLGFLFFSISFSISHFFFLRTGLYYTAPFLLRISFPFLFLFGPLYYYYVRILTDRNIVLRSTIWLHTIPFVLTFVISIPFFLSSKEEKIAHLNDLLTQTGLSTGVVIGILQVLHLFTYIAIVLKMLKQYDRQIKDYKSSIEKINLRWLRTGSAGFIVIFCFIFILVVLQGLGIQTVHIYSLSIPIMVSIVIYLLGYLGFRQPEIFSPVEDMGKKYERSSLTSDRAEEYADKLRAHMTAQRPHLDAELTLPALAEQLALPPHHVSQIINSRFNSNFFDFVNEYRVEEAKRLLTDKSRNHYTILAIAQEAGFNSKTSFNTAFKRFAGHTPSAYRNMKPASS